MIALLASACSSGSTPAEPSAGSPGLVAVPSRVATTLVFVGSPDSLRREVRPLVPTDPRASPAGWLYGDYRFSSLVGNNAEVVRDGDGYRPGVRDFDFRFPFSNAYASGGDPFRDTDAVLAQAFYWVNVAHDYAWAHGFDEPAGSWQDRRFGRGGPRRHRVIVRAQSSTQDARYVGDGTILLGLLNHPRRDTALDVDMILHEYFHAIFEAAVGSSENVDPSRSPAAAVNESMADYFAATITGDPLVTEYSLGAQMSGSAGHRLDANPSTFATYACGEPHATGSFWSATLWDVRRALQRDAADDRILRALLLQRAPPTFVSMRDGILAVDRSLGGSHQQTLWRVFAARGLGWSAHLTDCSSLGAAFDLPPDLSYAWLGGEIDRVLPADVDTVAVVTLANTGTRIWPARGQHSVSLAYHWMSPGGDTVVFEGRRTPLPHDVPPGARVAVAARVHTPGTPGEYLLQWDPVQEGVTWFSRAGAPTTEQRVSIGVRPALLARWIPGRIGDTLIAGDTALVPVRIVNEGSQSWTTAGPTPTKAGYHWMDQVGRTLLFEGLRTALPHDAAPGQSVDLPVKVVAPPGQFGRLRLVLDLVQDGVAWFSWRDSPTFAADVWIAPPSNVTWLDYDRSAAAGLAPGDTVPISVTLKNVGRDTWASGGPAPVLVGYHWKTPAGGAVVFDGLRTPLPADVPPGATVTVPVRVAGPPRVGSFVLVFDLVREGALWFSWAGLPTLAVPVQLPLRRVRWTPDPDRVTVPGDVPVAVVLTIANTGTVLWRADGDSAVFVGHRIRAADGRIVRYGAQLVPLPHDVPPGRAVSIPVTAQVSKGAGSYVVEWDLFQRKLGWFSWLGAERGTTRVTVVAAYHGGAR